VIPGIEPDGKTIWTYFEAMVPPSMPKSLAGHGLRRDRHRVCQLLPHHGCRVTVVEMMDQVMPVEDAEISALAAKQFEKQGMKIITGAKVSKVEKAGAGIKATVETARTASPGHRS
jgi:dihydrolipoamide dehydrogenase